MAPAAGRYMSITELDNLEGHTRTVSGEDHVSDLKNTLRVGVTGADDRHGVGVVEELASGSGNDGPGLADDLGTGRDEDGVADEVGTGVEEDDLAASILRRNTSVRRSTKDNVARTLAKIFLMAWVSSVEPLPFAPCERTLTKSDGA